MKSSPPYVIGLPLIHSSHCKHCFVKKKNNREIASAHTRFTPNLESPTWSPNSIGQTYKFQRRNKYGVIMNRLKAKKHFTLSTCLMREKMIRFSIFVVVLISCVPIMQEIEIQVEWIIVVHNACKFCQKLLPVKVQINK